jgi:hypothetical protein
VVSLLKSMLRSFLTRCGARERQDVRHPRHEALIDEVVIRNW